MDGVCRRVAAKLAEDKPAKQPPHFTGPKLREDQLRSLAWMLAQDGGMQVTERFGPPSPAPKLASLGCERSADHKRGQRKGATSNNVKNRQKLSIFFLKSVQNVSALFDIFRAAKPGLYPRMALNTQLRGAPPTSDLNIAHAPGDRPNQNPVMLTARNCARA